MMENNINKKEEIEKMKRIYDGTEWNIKENQEPITTPEEEMPSTQEQPQPVSQGDTPEEKAPVSFSWKKPITWMVIIGVIALVLWLVANSL